MVGKFAFDDPWIHLYLKQCNLTGCGGGGRSDTPSLSASISVTGLCSSSLGLLDTFLTFFFTLISLGSIPSITGGGGGGGILGSVLRLVVSILGILVRVLVSTVSAVFSVFSVFSVVAGGGIITCTCGAGGWNQRIFIT